jgi:hypothetical protein
MKYIILIGYLYIVFVLLLNLWSNFKEKKSAWYLNVIGVLALVYYIYKHITENF